MKGRINRRQALAGIGGVSLGALLAACGAGDADEPTATAEVETTTGATTTVEPQGGGGGDLASLFDESASCTLTPEETEGPFYIDADAIRSDIREDRDGTTLRLAVRVRDAERCEPIRNAVVDIWHCDAAGTYSGVQGDAGRFLRGAQVTDRDGIVEFTTIYPGWYPGRTVHIHAKVHLDSATALTTQVYFDEEVTAGVYEQEPYSSRTGRDTFNDNDTIFDEALLLDLSAEDGGYLGLASFDVASA